MNHSWKTLLFAVFILWLGGCESNENQIQADDNVLKVAIDVEAVTLDAEFTLNGGSFPASFYQRGAISLGAPRCRLPTAPALRHQAVAKPP